jgi:adenylate kinase
MNLVFIGPQGSGKGTQANLLSKLLKIPHISTGDIFREIEHEDSELALTVKKLIDKGKLVPDKVTNKIVENRLSRSDAKRGFILDGYPRDLGQAKFLSRICRIDACIQIAISDREAVRRISARRICPKCHEGYNIIFLKPRTTSV